MSGDFKKFKKHGIRKIVTYCGSHVLWDHLLRSEKVNNWTVSVCEERSLAHIAAERKLLPHNFQEWDLATNEGWAVAHEAARWGNLPPNFDRWDLKTRHGRTVADIAVQAAADAEEKLQQMMQQLERAKKAMNESRSDTHS